MSKIELIAYKVELSNGTKIKIDIEEVEKVIQASSDGSAVILKRGIIINPNFVMAIVPDYERIEVVQEANRINQFAIKEGLMSPERIIPLPDGFVALKAKIGEIKQLS